MCLDSLQKSVCQTHWICHGLSFIRSAPTKHSLQKALPATAPITSFFRGSYREKRLLLKTQYQALAILICMLPHEEQVKPISLMSLHNQRKQFRRAGKDDFNRRALDSAELGEKEEAPKRCSQARNISGGRYLLYCWCSALCMWRSTFNFFFMPQTSIYGKDYSLKPQIYRLLEQTRLPKLLLRPSPSGNGVDLTHQSIRHWFNIRRSWICSRCY